MMDSQLITFLQFGILLNIISFIIFGSFSLYSAFSLGIMKAYTISEVGRKTYSEYKRLKNKYEPMGLLFETVSIFIPFASTYILLRVLMNWREGVLFYELPIVLKMEQIEILKEKYEKGK